VASVATVLVLAGVGLLWLVWQRGPGWPPLRRGILRALAWGLLVLAVWPWAVAGGADRGPALALLALMVTGLVLVGGRGWRHWRRHPARAPRTRAGDDKDRGQPVDGMAPGALFLRRAWIAVLAGPLAGAGAILMALALDGLLAASAPADRVTSVMLAAPLAWTILIILAAYGMPLARRSAILGVVIALAAAGLFLLQPAGS